MNARIRALRIKNKMTQAQLGEVLGIKARTMSDIENGTSNPTVLQIEKLSKFFNVTSDYLLFGTENIEPIERDFLKIIRTDNKVYEALAGMLNSKNYFERLAA